MASLNHEARLLLGSLGDYARDLITPTVRLGVTGLSRSGKTVFITALVHGLLNGAHWPVFEAQAQGRIRSVRLEDQPDDTVPRFPIEDHLATLTRDRLWPEGTRRISELRLVIDYAGREGLIRGMNRSLTVDIVDYPGEWLLDLPLLDLSYREWCLQSLSQSRKPPRLALAGEWLALIDATDPHKSADETHIRKLAEAFTAYLRACRDERVSLSTLPPGRFLMPGDLEGSPALTFSPLPISDGQAPSGSLAATMERRFESYKRLVVEPFYRDHFARLDRQIVLVDALSAINAGPAAFADLELALTDILRSFRPGTNSWLSSILSRRVEKVLFAATKADHLHQSSHDRLEAILTSLTDKAMHAASFAGAAVDAIALASVRATRETQVREGGKMLPCIAGTPLAGETIDGQRFDGETETAIFPGELPDNINNLFDGTTSPADAYRFVRFRPAKPDTKSGPRPLLPHIRLDRAVQFLIGDRLT